jgi:O-6-methylguanine DNA methyltransferase
MISIYIRKADNVWYGFAFTGEKILATAICSTREECAKNLIDEIPFNVDHCIIEEGSEFTEKTMMMLRKLDSGDEEDKSFSLASEYMPEPNAKVLTASAVIPIGYVTSYGNIAKAADTEAQTVGKIMATNPLYPIVPCHRVVGTDFSLVGYGGRKDPPALQAKLARLKKEAKGFTAEKELRVNGRKITVYPVERVIKKAEKQNLNLRQQRKLFDCVESDNQEFRAS